MKDLGASTNLIIVLLHTLYGLYWLFSRKYWSFSGVKKTKIEYRRRAYNYWWLSWAAWVFVWILLLIKHNPELFPRILELFPTLATPSSSSSDSFSLIDVYILIFDNLNSVFLVVVYFAITRGQDLNAKQALRLAINIILSIAILYGTLYILLSDVRGLAYQIHRSFSMCLAVFTPILVGWAFNLRFRTSMLLMVGCLYGLVQPIIYATQLPSFQQAEFKTGLDFIQPIVAMIVGLLKICWAIVFTKLLESRYASSENLILTEKTTIHDFWTGGTTSTRLHAVILISLYLVLLVRLSDTYREILTGFGIALSIIASILSFWQSIWGLWRTTMKPNAKKKT